jgi:hypothetical protein
MKIEKIHVFGFEPSLRGMRNPLNSWHLSDSRFYPEAGQYPPWEWQGESICAPEHPVIGPNDLKLAKKLIKAGPEHRKFLRQIQIWIDITIPRYVHQELDTYKVATVRNSCSTMHKLGYRDLDQEDFEQPIPKILLMDLNALGYKYRKEKQEGSKTEANKTLRELKNLLPEGFLQKATYTFNYETALTMYRQRRNHRLPEWNEQSPGSITSFIKSLPYMEEFLGE